ncbi:hypothetical protein DPM13_09375 [Paracoccus mutanolyticus]|uniref:Uncharacterized protein n=1 Tax=Paracoccus mutanolyticus TaxID=1499308 RepID=A0ABN5M5N8_9RHOB|nr:hypothetical protein DPM13_09375 [Paracoccus mutanolyticus]
MRRAPGSGHRRARGRTRQRKPAGQRLQHRVIAASRPRHNSRDDDPVRRIDRDDGRDALQDPEGRR